MNTRIQSFLSSYSRPSPARDWFTALVVVAAIACLLLLYAIYLYIGLNAGLFESPAPTSASVITISADDIRTLHDAYQARSVNFSAHNLPAPAVIDPSK